MGASGSKSSSKPVDLTPTAFKNLQSPFADVLAGLLGFGSSGTGGTGGPTPGVVPNSPTNAIVGVNNRTRGGFMGSDSAGQGGQHRNIRNRFRPQQQAPAPAPVFNPSGNPLSGIPTFPGDLTAPIGTNEQSILDQMMSFMGSGTSGPGSPNATLEAMMAGQGPSGAGSFQPGSLEALMQERMAAMQTPGYDAEGGNPFLAAMIEAAQRPTQQALEETLSRTLPGRFTQAGQFTQPQGSSAFDRAAAIATRGAGQTMADIASQLSFGSFEAERGRQFESQESARAQESEAMAQELERRGMFAEADRARKFAESEASRDRQLEAAQAAPGVQKQQLDSMIANLQAQALPRLIQDMGIERGLEQFNNQVNALLSTLGITAGVTRPVVGNKSSSSSAGISLK